MAGKWKDIPIDLLHHIILLSSKYEYSSNKYSYDTRVYSRIVALISSVCTSWRDALPSAVTNLSFSWCGRKHFNNFMQSVIPKFTNLRVVSLSFHGKVEETAIETVADYCHNLRKLDISDWPPIGRSLGALGRGCPWLKDLNDSGVVDLLSCCRELRILRMSVSNKPVTDEQLRAVGSHCSRLRTLRLWWCFDVTDEGVMSLVAGCPDLEHISLLEASITDESVTAIARGCPRLTSLELSNCANTTDKALYALAESGRGRGHGRENDGGDNGGLERLILIGSTVVTAPAVQAVVDAFPGLHTSNCLEKMPSLSVGCSGGDTVRCPCAAPRTK